MDKVYAASAFTCCFVCRQPCESKCSSCRVTRYCGAEHQLQDWEQHKPVCAWLQEKLAGLPALKGKHNTEQARVRQKMELAVALWRKQVDEDGDASAAYRLANCYCLGEGVEEDMREYVRLLQQAACNARAGASASSDSATCLPPQHRPRCAAVSDACVQGRPHGR